MISGRTPCGCGQKSNLLDIGNPIITLRPKKEGTYTVSDGTIELVCAKAKIKNGYEERDSIILEIEYENAEYFLSFTAGNGETFEFGK